jgi:hypothetical protein
MSTAAEWVISRTVRIGAGLSCEMTAGPGGFTCEWSERPRRLSRKQVRRYRAGRDALLKEVAARLGGGGVLVVEV